MAEDDRRLGFEVSRRLGASLGESLFASFLSGSRGPREIEAIFRRQHSADSAAQTLEAWSVSSADCTNDHPLESTQLVAAKRKTSAISERA